MKLGILGTATAVAALAASVASATPVTIELNLVSSPTSDIAGLGSGTLDYDVTTSGWDFFGTGVTGPADTFNGTFDFTLAMFGATFNDADDPGAVMSVEYDFVTSSALEDPLSFNFNLSGLSIVTGGGTVTGIGTTTAVGTPNLTFIGTNPTSGNDVYSMEVLVAGTPAVIPLPAPFLLLGAGLAGLGLRSKLRKKAA